MSVKAKPGTGSQALESKISETTNRKDKGQNRSVIEWLSRAGPDSPFLETANRVWSYGETVDEVERRAKPEHVVLHPRLDPDSVFDVLAGLAGGGVTVVADGPAASTDPKADLVVFTSGTSGRAKGVRLTLANLEAASRASRRHLGHGPEDTWLLMMPLHHVAGLSILVRSAYAGGSVRLLPGFEPAAVTSVMEGEVSMVSMVPTMLHRVLGAGAVLRNLRAVLIGGGPIPAGLLETAEERGLPVLPTYGMTETFGQVATLKPGSKPARAVDPLPGVDIRIEPGGRVALRGEQVSPGYVGEPDRDDPWFITGDLGELVDGRLRILGRADSMIVTGGENVSPEQVEAELREHDLVSDALLVGVPDPEWGSKVCCVVVAEAEVDELRAWLRERIAGHMVPKEWRRVHEIPKTALGKPDRQAATALFS